jgi:hypothetical protein
MDTRTITIQGTCDPEEYMQLLRWFLDHRITSQNAFQETGRLAAGNSPNNVWVEMFTLKHSPMDGYEVRLSITPQKLMFFPTENIHSMLELMALIGLRTLKPEEMETKWVCTGCGHNHDIRPAQCDVCLGTSFNESSRPKHTRLV